MHDVRTATTVTKERKEVQETLMRALVAQREAEEQSRVNEQRAAELSDMLMDLLGTCERYVKDVRDMAQRVGAQQWDQVEAMAEIVGPLERRVADIRRLL